MTSNASRTEICVGDILNAAGLAYAFGLVMDIKRGRMAACTRAALAQWC